jgi:hypothetical protein
MKIIMFVHGTSHNSRWTNFLITLIAWTKVSRNPPLSGQNFDSSIYNNVMQWSRRFLGMVGWDPSVCKSHRLHVDILWFSFIKLGYIVSIPLRWWIIFLQSWTLTGYFSNSTGSSVTKCRLSPIIDVMCTWMNRMCKMNERMDGVLFPPAVRPTTEAGWPWPSQGQP